jgi:hypothetical protein
MPIPPRVSVVALRTADLARSTAFYTALGWELSSWPSSAATSWPPSWRASRPAKPSCPFT